MTPRYLAALLVGAAFSATAASRTCSDISSDLDSAFAGADPARVEMVVVSLPVAEGGRSAALQHAEALRRQLEQRGAPAEHIYVEDRGAADRDDSASLSYCASVAHR